MFETLFLAKTEQLCFGEAKLVYLSTIKHFQLLWENQNKIWSPSLRPLKTVPAVNNFSFFQQVQEEQTYFWKLLASSNSIQGICQVPHTPCHFISYLPSIPRENIILFLGGKNHVENAYKLWSSFTLLRELFKVTTNCDFMGYQQEIKLK